jgi:hypothetical protein
MVNITPYSDEANLRYHWGAVYDIRKTGPWKWQAVAKFGTHDVLIAESAYELRQIIFRHYSPKTYGYEQAKKLGR